MISTGAQRHGAGHPWSDTWTEHCPALLSQAGQSLHVLHAWFQTPQQGPAQGLDSLACTSLRKELEPFSPWHENIPKHSPNLLSAATVGLPRSAYLWSWLAVPGGNVKREPGTVWTVWTQLPTGSKHHPALLGDKTDTGGVTGRGQKQGRRAQSRRAGRPEEQVQW